MQIVIIKKNKPLLIGLIVFIIVVTLTQFLSYQQYLIFKGSEAEKAQQEANRIADKLKTSLSYSLSATRTLAFVVENYGVPANFDSIAGNILQSNPFIDAVQLTRKGIITHVYPLEGNEKAIGYDVLADSSRRDEALRALRDKKLFFAGPFELRQGGQAVVGRLPIFLDSDFWGFSVVIIRFPTLLDATGISEAGNSEFTYQLSKKNPATGKEEFFLNSMVPSGYEFATIQVPDGQWNLYVISRKQSSYLSSEKPLAIVGFLLSAMAGMFSWNLARQPQKLKRRIAQVTNDMEVYQRSATASLRRTNRLFEFTSKVNQMAIHVVHEDDMYAEACKIAVETGKYKMAWIGMINREEEIIRHVCSAGEEQNYLQEVTPISLKAGTPMGPILKMIETGSFVFSNDIAADPLMAHLSEKALAIGYKANIVLPIKKFGEIVGSFSLYSTEPNAFDENEIHLLLETVGNISFVLENFEKEKLRKQAEFQMHAEKSLTDSIINSLPGIFYFYDFNGKFLRWNKNFELVSGYSSEQLNQIHPLDFFQGEERALLKNKIDNVFQSGQDEVIAKFHTKGSGAIPYYFNGKKITFHGQDYLIGMGLDITERVKAENALIARTEEIEKLSAHLQNIREEEGSRIALEIHDVLGQQLTALKMDATWIKKKTTQEDDALGERISRMISLIDDTIKTIRRISSELRPSILDDFGLVAALEWQGTEFERNTGIKFSFFTNNNDISLKREFAINVFRIFQEALTNIARHSHATEVITTFVQENNHIRLEVKDNGIGFDLNKVNYQKSIGLLSMKERARILNGEIVIDSNTPNGTVITMNVPLDTKAVTL